jgi:hypothetical protein
LVREGIALSQIPKWKILTSGREVGCQSSLVGTSNLFEYSLWMDSWVDVKKRSTWRVWDLLQVGSLNSQGYEALLFEEKFHQNLKIGTIPHMFSRFLES